MRFCDPHPVLRYHARKTKLTRNLPSRMWPHAKRMFQLWQHLTATNQMIVAQRQKFISKRAYHSTLRSRVPQILSLDRRSTRSLSIRGTVRLRKQARYMELNDEVNCLPYITSLTQSRVMNLRPEKLPRLPGIWVRCRLHLIPRLDQFSHRSYKTSMTRRIIYEPSKIAH